MSHWSCSPLRLEKCELNKMEILRGSLKKNQAPDITVSRRRLNYISVALLFNSGPLFFHLQSAAAAAATGCSRVKIFSPVFFSGRSYFSLEEKKLTFFLTFSLTDILPNPNHTHTKKVVLYKMLERKFRRKIYYYSIYYNLSLIHIWRCRRSTLCRSRWSPYH